MVVSIYIYDTLHTIYLQLDYENKWFDCIPRLTYTDKSTYVESQTKQYDQVSKCTSYQHIRRISVI